MDGWTDGRTDVYVILYSVQCICIALDRQQTASVCFKGPKKFFRYAAFSDGRHTLSLSEWIGVGWRYRAVLSALRLYVACRSVC